MNDKTNFLGYSQNIGLTSNASTTLTTNSNGVNITYANGIWATPLTGGSHSNGIDYNSILTLNIINELIINLHYYTDAAVETTRFNEVLQYNKLIISETSPHEYDYYNRNIYKEFVEFVDVIDRDISKICNLIDMYLNNEELYNNKIRYIKENKYKLRDISEYFLKRNLLSIIEPSEINIDYPI